MYTQEHINGYFQGLEQAKKVIQANPKKNHAQLIQSELTHSEMMAVQKGFRVRDKMPRKDEVFMCCVLSLAFMAIVLVWGMQ